MPDNQHSLAPLADRMKAVTWSLHKQAETSGVVFDILKKRVSKSAYILYLRNLLHIYEGLEAHSPAAPLALDTALLRAPSLRRDLEGLAGESAYRLPLMQSTHRYRGSIDTAAEQSPAALLGHYYVRYLGDLNGGAVLGRLLGDALKLGPSVLQFYAFPEIDDITAYREYYRGAFGALSLSPADQKDAIAAARSAFEFNIQISLDVKAQAQSGA